MEPSRPHTVMKWNSSQKEPASYELIGEEPLSVRVQGNPYSVVMRTPGDEMAHVAGFCLAEGIVDSPDDYTSMAFCDGTDSNVVAVTLKPDRRKIISEILDRREFISQTSCGLCGKEIVKDLHQILKPLKDNQSFDIHLAGKLLKHLPELQPLRQKTRAAHAAVIYDSDFNLLASAEDVGRHNALDKAVGKLFINGSLWKASLLMLSSRISYELVQKAARARIPVILALSRPTALAVDLASKLNMTLGCEADDSGLYLFCGSHRFNS